MSTKGKASLPVGEVGVSGDWTLCDHGNAVHIRGGALVQAVPVNGGSLRSFQLVVHLHLHLVALTHLSDKALATVQI